MAVAAHAQTRGHARLSVDLAIQPRGRTGARRHRAGLHSDGGSGGWPGGGGIPARHRSRIAGSRSSVTFPSRFGHLGQRHRGRQASGRTGRSQRQHGSKDTYVYFISRTSTCRSICGTGSGRAVTPRRALQVTANSWRAPALLPALGSHAVAINSGWQPRRPRRASPLERLSPRRSVTLAVWLDLSHAAGRRRFPGCEWRSVARQTPDDDHDAQVF